jgi:hypothetical protein
VFSRARVVVVGVLVVLVGLLASTSTAPAEAGRVTGAGQDLVATHRHAVLGATSTHAATSKRCRRSHARAHRRATGRPGVARLTGVGLPNAVQLRWGAAPNATRYRVIWNAAPFGKFPGPLTYAGGGWLPATARSVTLPLPTTPHAGDKMVGVAYANAVFARIQTGNVCRPGVTPQSAYLPVFPKAPDPGTGDRLRLGSYNVELEPESGPRVAAIADNIADHGVEVVALQEASPVTAQALVGRLGRSWSAVAPARASDQQILYRNDLFRVRSQGSFEVPNPKPGSAALVTPWAKLARVNPSEPGRSQDLVVVSLHLNENPSASNLAQKASTGAAALVALRAIAALDPEGLPVVSAGDYRYMREPFCDEPTCHVEAQPTFVRHGYYDAMAAVTKVGVQYTTVNGHTRTNQAASLSGVGTRADYIMLKGFRGSVRYENVVNRFVPGTSKVTPSDHNLILADLVVPYAS